MFRGKLPNSAFCLFDPTGTKQLCEPSRGPHTLIDAKVGERFTSVSQALKENSKPYQRNSTGTPFLQDFRSTAEAINIAAGDQRLLVVVPPNANASKAHLRAVLANQHFVGRFHVDIAEVSSQPMRALIQPTSERLGIWIIQSGKFGQTGTLLKALGKDATALQIRSALVECNKFYSSSEKRRDREQHIADGEASGISYTIEKPSNARTEILRNGGRRAK